MSAPLSIGFVALPDFTMLALAGFLDTLRLAADEGDRSRPIDCRWTVMTEDGQPVRASNGVQVEPDCGLGDPSAFDYVVVAGGTLHRARNSDRLHAWLRRASDAGVPLVGICTGSFVLARAGLMDGRVSCVSWFHRAEFEHEFPDLAVSADRLFVVDGDRITCAGGTGVLHLASHLVDLHLGTGRSHKGLRVMIEDGDRGPFTPQPLPDLPGLDAIRDARLRQAVLLIERNLSVAPRMDAIAAEVGLSPRHLRRRFADEFGATPVQLRERLRLAKARALLRTTDLSVTAIAHRTGFADAPHLARRCRREWGLTPRALRAGAEVSLR